MNIKLFISGKPTYTGKSSYIIICKMGFLSVDKETNFSMIGYIAPIDGTFISNGYETTTENR